LTDHKDIVIIGAGQAGLSTSYHLTQLGREHLVLEQADTSFPSWHKRWDSFSLVLPNWTVQLPGSPVASSQADGFFTKAELLEHLADFTDNFEPPVRYGVRVLALEKNERPHRFLLHTNQGSLEADNVVVATGTYQEPRLPAFSADFSPDIFQLHTDEYLNPEQLPSGAVLVVGSGQSGCQIAEELYQSGRKVYLSVSSANRIPRVYRGRDSVWWLGKMHFFDQTVDQLKTSQERFAANPLFSGKNGGHDINLHQFYRDGVILLGRMQGARGSHIYLETDLHDNLEKSDLFVSQVQQGIDAFIAKQALEAPPPPSDPPLQDAYQAPIIEELDLAAEGISTVLWGTGYTYDFSWIRLPVLDQDGYPIQERGISPYAGLYFMGLYWLHDRKSGLLWGVGQDAEYIAQHIALNTQAKMESQQLQSQR
jgi:putative flavoprotein involved in K+ transport